MSDASSRELRVLSDVARAAGDCGCGHEAALAAVAERVRDEFGLASVRVVARESATGGDAALEEARRSRAPASAGSRLAVPLLVGGECAGFLVGEGREVRTLAAKHVQLLAAIGVVVGVLVEQARQHRKLQGALDELVRVDRLKDEFVSIASHELRGPLGVVYGIAATLHERYDDLAADHQAQLRELLLAEAGRVRGLADQLLDLSRLDSGRLPVEARPFRPRQVVDELVPRVAAGHAGEVEVTIDPGRELVADRAAFEHVVGNLLANAVRYGRPPVVVGALDAGDGVDVVVEDRGPGVEPEFVPYLFDRFTRSERSRRGGAAGVGLGLAIAHRYADALGGDLRYEPGSPGSRFVLSLPSGATPGS
jgi:signal transduction histidine kinase